MPLTSDQRKRVQGLLGEFCEKRVPPQHRAKLRYGYVIRGSSVTLNEFRPSLTRPGVWTESAVARFKFDQTTGGWSVFWQRANGQWRRCDWRRPANRFANVLAEVVTDSYGVFFG
jgi:hypothetical protein